MYRAGKGVRSVKSTSEIVRLLLILPCSFLLGPGCGKEPPPEAGAGAVRITRYNCNIAEAQDVINVYAEVVNGSSEGTGPLDLVARVIRPEEEIVEGRTSMGRLGAREARQVSLRFTCRGRIALRHVSLAVEPTPAPEETDEDPQAGR
jgi:hypothetical protein